MINLFAFFASEDGKQLLSSFYEVIFSFCAEKCPKDVNYADRHHGILSDSLKRGVNITLLKFLLTEWYLYLEEVIKSMCQSSRVTISVEDNLLNCSDFFYDVAVTTSNIHLTVYTCV